MITAVVMEVHDHMGSKIFKFLAKFQLVIILTSSNALANSNITSEFMAQVNQISERDSAIDRERLKSYQIVLVPGLVTDFTQKVGKVFGWLGITSKDGFLASFFQQSNWMHEASIYFEMAPINREGGCDENGEVIARVIATSAKPVILVSQSKAGADIMHALVHHPEIVDNIAGWVAYQPPHAGSILADIMQSETVLKYPSNLFVKTLGGTPLAFTDMTTTYRSKFNFANADRIKALTSAFPIVTLVTTATTVSWERYLLGRNSSFSFLAPFVGVISEHDGGSNDGIATVKGTCIRNSDCVYLTGIDHFAAVMNTSPFLGPSKVDRIALFRALLELLLNRIETRNRQL